MQLQAVLALAEELADTVLDDSCERLTAAAVASADADR
jgi:hypothetical protein